MKNILKVVLGLVFVVLVVAVILHLAGVGNGEPGAVEIRAEVVTFAEATEGSIREEVMVTGEVHPTAEVALAPKVTGRLMALAADEGDKVRKEQVVAELDRDSFEAAVARAKAAVELAEANVNQAQVVYENARNEYNRTRALFEQGTVPQSRLDDADAAHKVAASAVVVANAARSQSQAMLELAEIDLREAAICAPFDAVVAERLLDVGAFVSAGTPVLRLVSMDTVKVTAGVAERHLGDLAAGQTRATVTVDSLPARTFEGILHRVSPVVDKDTRTGQVDIRIPNRDGLLKPGMYARVTLVTRQRDSAVLVPNDAVLTRADGGYYVYIESQGRARRANVELGVRSSRNSEVLSGVSPGERVVVSGEGNLFDGAFVSEEELSR